MQRTLAMLSMIAMLAGPAGGQQIDQSEAASKHIAAARAAAGSKWADKVDGLCGLGNRPPVRDPSDPAFNRQLPVTLPEVKDWPEDPAKIFDNLYFVGSKGVSAFAIVTDAGIIITDAMWAYDIERSVVDGLTKLGLDAKQIKYVIIPHGHPDHYGGANFLHDRFGAKIVAPRGDLDTIKEYEKRDTTPIPKAYDVLIGDGDSLTLGKTTVNFHIMAGHTPGGLVMTFPVFQGGTPHRMLIWAAGGGAPGGPEKQKMQVPGLEKLLTIVQSDKVDALAENHGSHALADSFRSNPGAGNPFLVGREAVTGFLRMRLECDLARLATPPRAPRP